MCCEQTCVDFWFVKSIVRWCVIIIDQKCQMMWTSCPLSCSVQTFSSADKVDIFDLFMICIWVLQVCLWLRELYTDSIGDIIPESLWGQFRHQYEVSQPKQTFVRWATLRSYRTSSNSVQVVKDLVARLYLPCSQKLQFISFSAF